MVAAVLGHRRTARCVFPHTVLHSVQSAAFGGVLKRFLLGFGCAVVASVLRSAAASHSWGNYHWARTSNPFTVPRRQRVHFMIRSSGAPRPTGAGRTCDTSIVAGQAKASADPRRVASRCATGITASTAGSASHRFGLTAATSRRAPQRNDSYLSSGYSTTNKQRDLPGGRSHVRARPPGRVRR